jgi:uncharacterized protein (TIGR02147 family)
MAGRSELNVFDYTDYRGYLRDYYLEQKKRRAFSFRKFSQEGGLKAPNYLKLVIDGARNLTDTTARKFAKAIRLSGEPREYFLELVRFNQAKNSAEHDEVYAKLSGFRRYHAARTLEQAHAAYHSHWYLPAIRELAAARSFKNDPGWIAAHMKPRISPSEAKRAIEILLELGFLVLNDGGGLTQGHAVLSTGPETIGLHIASYHRQMIERAKLSIDEVSARERDISSLTLCIGERNLKLIKQRIRRFRRELVELAVLDEDPSQVIQVNFQLFPLSESC